MKIAGSCKTLLPGPPGNILLKAGVRISASIDDVSPQNFAEHYFQRRPLAPQLDSNNQLVINPATGLPALVQISSIERYQRTLLLSNSGFSPTNAFAWRRRDTVLYQWR